MIPVKEVSPDVFQPIKESVLTSLDGEVRATIGVILHESWTPEDRAKFGVYMAEEFITPEGKVRIGSPRYERFNNIILQMFDVEDAPIPLPDPMETLSFLIEEIKTKLLLLEQRIVVLENK